MSGLVGTRRVTAALALALLAFGGGSALAQPATWRSEQPTPAGSPWPIGLGKVGDVEFFEPNKGLLITAGNAPTVPPGVWAYDGTGWHELATVCGATDGRIAWAGPEEFWTVSDGRPGQTGKSGIIEQQPPLEDNTLCHFAGGKVVGSYAHPAFEVNSYQAMHGAACLDGGDCWFAGDPLSEPQIGAFQLHWNGSSLEAQPYPNEGHAAWDLLAVEGQLLESVLLAPGDRTSVQLTRTPVIHRINAPGVSPTLEAEEGTGPEGLPLYGTGEPAKALDFLHLSAADGLLWAAAGPKGSEPGQVTVALRQNGTWSQLIGPSKPLGAVMSGEAAEEQAQLGGPAKNATVTGVAAEPGTASAWIALSAATPAATARAVLVRVSSEGQLLEERTLPSALEEAEGIGPKGAAKEVVCPEVQDCWLVTQQGWLFHLAREGERTLPANGDPNFGGLITERPVDQGLPQRVIDAPPADTSGIVEEAPNYGGSFLEAKAGAAALGKVTLPLLTHLHSRLVHGTTLELRFHLAVEARVRLMAERQRKVVAATPTRTLAQGNRSISLRLDRRRWPNKLKLQTHALAPLPEVSSVTGEGANIGTISTRMTALPRTLGWTGLLP